MNTKMFFADLSHRETKYQNNIELCTNNKVKYIEKYTQVVLKKQFDIESSIFKNIDEMYKQFISHYKTTISDAVNGYNNDPKKIIINSIRHKDKIMSEKKELKIYLSPSSFYNKYVYI